MSSKLLYGLFLLLAVYCICDVAADEDEELLDSDIGTDTDATKYDNTFYNPDSNESYPRVNQIALFNPFKEISFYGSTCHCGNRLCDCCAGVRIPKHNFDKYVCANVQYLPQQVGIEASLTVNQNPIISKTVSLSNPPAICKRIPDFPLVKLCIHFHDLSKSGNQIHGCIDLQARVKKIPALKLHFPCFTI